MPLEKRQWDPLWLANALSDPARPIFLMGSVPPREGTTFEQMRDICSKFVARSRSLATDGFIVYDIQDESSRNAEARPFPFRRTMDPATYAQLFPTESGKSAVLYKAVNEEAVEDFDKWLQDAFAVHGHRTLNLVGPASSSDVKRVTLADAAGRIAPRDDIRFGCVTIAERHLAKGTEHLNILRKTGLGARWFISQAVYDADATVKLLHDYGDECRRRGEKPAKIILTFAPCGRPKTMAFIKWLGIQVPELVEARVLAKAAESKEAAVAESIQVCSEILTLILQRSAGSGVPLGVSVESVSGFREEIDGAFELFRQLQVIMLDSSGSPWGVRWYRVPLSSMQRTDSKERLDALNATEQGLMLKAGAPGTAPPAPTALTTTPGSLFAALAGLRDVQRAWPWLCTTLSLAFGLGGGVGIGLRLGLRSARTL